MGEEYKSLNRYKSNKRIILSKKLKFYCEKHNQVFFIRGGDILKGHKCPLCAKEQIKLKQLTPYSKIKEDFKKSGYKLISTEKDYLGIKTPLKFICPNHPDKENYLSYDALKSGTRCAYCAKNKRYEYEEYLDVFKQNGFIPLFTKEDCKNTSVLLKCRCSFTGKETKLSFNTVSQKGHVCPYCSKSLGESKITKILENYNIEYDFQKTFKNCKLIKKLRFDFYLPKYNLCIEFQGQHHVRPVQFGDMTLEEAIYQLGQQIKKDNIKRKFCIEEKINLLEIYFWDISNIEDILIRKLVTLDASTN